MGLQMGQQVSITSARGTAVPTACLCVGENTAIHQSAETREVGWIWTGNPYSDFGLDF